MSGGGFEVVTLWKCSYCGWITDGSSPVHGPITSQAYCQGVPVRHPRMKMDRFAVAPVDQVVEALTEVVHRWNITGNHHAANKELRIFAANLKPTGD